MIDDDAQAWWVFPPEESPISHASSPTISTGAASRPEVRCSVGKRNPFRLPLQCLTLVRIAVALCLKLAQLLSSTQPTPQRRSNASRYLFSPHPR
jgi:hypothetical protein